MPYTETETQLASELRLSDFNFMESGSQPLTFIYDRVYQTYPNLCNNDFRCCDCHNTDHINPEWHHVVRSALDSAKKRPFSRVQKRANSKGYWFFAEINEL